MNGKEFCSFYGDMLWQSNFVALPSSYIIDGVFPELFLNDMQFGEQTKSKFIVQVYLVVLTTCQAFSISLLDIITTT